MLDVWSVGVLEGWSTGLLEGWGAGVMKGWSVGELEGWDAGGLECWSVGEFWSAGVLGNAGGLACWSAGGLEDLSALTPEGQVVYHCDIRYLRCTRSLIIIPWLRVLHYEGNSLQVAYSRRG